MAQGRASKFVTREEVEDAFSKTLSNRAAARYLGMSFTTLKKYARKYIDQKTGKTLWELHKNEAGRGIPKHLSNNGKEPALLDILEGRVSIDHFPAIKIKQRLIFEGYLAERCNRCGFCERRVTDYRVPLILHHINGKKRDYTLKNLEMLCYNCSFLYAVSPITDQQVETMEDYISLEHSPTFDWELDEHHLEHLKSLGLYQEEPKPGEEYISNL